jgi:hypothetical protein
MNSIGFGFVSKQGDSEKPVIWSLPFIALS